MTIEEFIRARLNEYEVALDDATSGPPFSPLWTSGGAAVDAVLSRADVRDIDERAIWLRRDLAAKRVVLELHVCPCPADCGECGECSGEHHADPTPAPCETLRALASVYSDHPDYQQKWAL